MPEVDANYLTDVNVAKRWEYYTMARTQIDRDELVRRSLRIQPHMVVGDSGCSSLRFALRLALEHGHVGKIYGIDPNICQAEVPIVQAMVKGTNIEYMQGKASALPLPDNSVDVFTAIDSYYHEPNIFRAIAESLRVLRPEGVAGYGTSGDFNKPRIRAFEKIGATATGRKPPPLMNAGFDTDIARKILPNFFDNVYQHSQHDLVVAKTVRDIYIIMASIQSLYNQNDPPIALHSKEDYAVHDRIVPIIKNEIKMFGAYVDFIQRDFFVCSRLPQDHLLDEGFVRVKAQ